MRKLFGSVMCNPMPFSIALYLTVTLVIFYKTADVDLASICGVGAMCLFCAAWVFYRRFYGTPRNSITH